MIEWLLFVFLVFVVWWAIGMPLFGVDETHEWFIVEALRTRPNQSGLDLCESTGIQPSIVYAVLHQLERRGVVRSHRWNRHRLTYALVPDDPDNAEQEVEAEQNAP